MKLLITGGHLTPALAFIDYLRVAHPDVAIIFVGRLYARKRSKQPAHEKEEIEKRQIQFIAFDSGKLIAAHTFFQLFHLLLLIITVPKALKLLIQIRPTVVLTFGGYLGVPLALAAWLLRIPIITHEQTHGLGMANRVIGIFAKKIGLAHVESMTQVDKSKSQVVGNPLRQALHNPNQTKPAWLTNQADRPILYITGGSQGSEILNATIMQLLDNLTKNWLVIHQCGTASKDRDYQQELNSAAAKLSASGQKRYFIREWILDQELAWIYQHANLVISRAGANTVEELISFAIPSILIPLPFSHQNEQKQNAEAMQSLGGALLIDQKQLNPTSLLHALDRVKPQLGQMKASLQQNSRSLNSCELLFDLIQNVQSN